MGSEHSPNRELPPERYFSNAVYSIQQLDEQAGILKLFPSFSLRLKREDIKVPCVYTVDAKALEGDFFDVESERRMAEDVIRLLNTVLVICHGEEAVLQFLAKSAVPFDWILSRIWGQLNISVPYPLAIYPHPEFFDLGASLTSRREKIEYMNQRKNAVDDFRKGFGRQIQGKSVVIIDDVIDSAQTVSRMLYVNLQCGAKKGLAVSIGELSPPWWRYGQRTCPKTGLQDPVDPEHIQRYGRFVCEQLPLTEPMVHFRNTVNSFADQIALAVR